MFILQLSEPQDAQRRVYFHLVDSTDGTTPKTGQTGKAWISKNGGTPAQTSASLVEVDATNMPGLYYVQLTVAEVMQPGWIQVRYKAAATLEFQDIGQLVAYDPYSKILGMNQSPMAMPSGDDVDYKKIARLIDEGLSKLKFPNPEKIDLSKLQSGITDVYRAIRSITIPEAEKLELGPVLEALAGISGQINSLKFPITDLSGLVGQISTLTFAFDNFLSADDTAKAEARGEVVKVLEEVRGAVTDIDDRLKKLNLVINLVNPPKAPEPVTPGDPVEEANKYGAA